MKPEYISLCDAVGLAEKSESSLVRLAAEGRIDLFVLLVNRWGIELKSIGMDDDGDEFAYPVTWKPTLLDGEYRLLKKTVQSFLADPNDSYLGVPEHQTFESQDSNLFMFADSDAFLRSANPVKLTPRNLCFRFDDLTALIVDQKASTDTPPTAKEWQATQTPENAGQAATPSTIAKRHAELMRARVPAYTKQTAEEFDCSERWVRKCVKNEKSKPPSGIGNMTKQMSSQAKKPARK
jgi:hypothetical protein